MKSVLDRKKKRFMHYFLGIPLAIVFTVINIVLITWLFHVLYNSFANNLDHMSLYEWAGHLYTIIKGIIDKIFRI
ncbi:MAG: hypothetical protein WBF08_10660 [Candidatus Bathyarchaeia archaeon]